MTIINKNDYILLQSPYIDEVIENPSDYDSIEIEGNINCCQEDCGTSVVSTSSLTLGDTQWQVDLDFPVKTNQVIYHLYVKNINTGIMSDALSSGVDLGYIDANCAFEVCDLEAYDAHFAPLFENQINDFFETVGITSDVTVTFVNNVMYIADLPAGFVLYSADYGADPASTPIYFSYGANGSKAFLGIDGIYIMPEFFADQTTFTDGVYTFTLKYIKSEGAGFIIEKSCSFIDINIKCQVALTLQRIKDEAAVGVVSKPASVLHILYFALINASDCGCNCDQLCEAFKALYNILSKLNPTLTNNCNEC